MHSGYESPAVFEKTVKYLPKAVAQIMIAISALMIVLGAPTAMYVVDWKSGIAVFVVGLGLLLYSLIMNLSRIVRISSNDANLVIYWEDGKSRIIPWSEITDIKHRRDSHLAEEVFFDVWLPTTQELTIKRGSARPIFLSGAFASDKAFVSKLQNHPVLQRNRKA